MWSERFLGPKGKITHYNDTPSTTEDSGRIIENVGELRPLGAKGKVTIEITDVDTGEVVASAEDNNFIAKGVDYMYEMQMKNLFQRNKHSGGFSTNEIVDPFRTMYLTDADHEEDPENEWLMRGKLIGEGRTNTNVMLAAPLGGQYNSVESFVDHDMVRIVIDFPAESANGEISSVYFLSGDALFSGISSFKTVEETDTLTFVKYNNRVYTMNRQTQSSGTRTSYLYVMNSDLEVIGRHTVSDNNRYSGKRWGIVGGFTIYNDRMYFIGSNGPVGGKPGVLWSVPMSVVTDEGSTEYFMGLDSTIEHLNQEYLPHGGIDSGVTYNPDNSTFIVAQGGGSTRIISIYDTSFNLLSSHELSWTDAAPNNRLLLYHEGALHMGKSVIDMDKWSGITIGHSFEVAGFTEDNNVIFKDGTSRTYVIPKIGFSSRAKLSSPVNKTTSNNMKVTYDFALPSFYGDSY